MPDIVLNLIALALLGSGVLLLLRVFAAPMAAYPRRTRRVLTLATAGALIGAPFWWAGAPLSFAWALPALAFRFLAAAALAFGAVGLMVMARPSPARIRFALGMVATYLAPLLVLIVIFHRGALDWSQPLPWGLVVFAGGLAAGSVLEMVKSKDLRPGVAPRPVERAFWALGIVVFGLWAAALMLWPQGDLALVWPWPSDPLTTRLIGAMLLTLFMMSWMARNRAELARVAGVGMATYGLWVLIACALRFLAGQPFPWLYAAVLGGAGVLGAIRAVRP